jgi:hypothetical protein
MKCWLVCESWTTKDVDGTGHELLYNCLPGGIEGNLEGPSQIIRCPGRGSNMLTFRVWSGYANHYTAMYGWGIREYGAGKIHDREVHSVFISPSIVRVYKARMMEWRCRKRGTQKAGVYRTFDNISYQQEDTTLMRVFQRPFMKFLDLMKLEGPSLQNLAVGSFL